MTAGLFLMTCLKVPAGKIPDLNFMNRSRKSTKYLNSFTSNCYQL